MCERIIGLSTLNLGVLDRGADSAITMEACRRSMISPEIPTIFVSRRATPTLSRAYTVQFHQIFRVSAARIPLEPKTQDRMFILGVGYVGKFFGQKLMNSGWLVSSLVIVR